MAYYSQTPDKSQINRFLKLQVQGLKPIFPEVKYFKNILDILQDLGHGLNNPITHQELKAYCKLMDIELNPFEIRAIMRLSKAFVNTYYESKDKDFVQPYREKTTSIN